MKKVLSIVAVSVLAISSVAKADSLTGWYVQGDLGASSTYLSDEGDKFKKTTFDPRISVGYQLGDLRLVGDYTYVGKVKWSEGTEAAEASIHSLGFSALYDFDLGSPIVPYAGVRLAANHVKAKFTDTGSVDKYSTTKFGYGAVVGAQYKVSEQLAINAGLEYNLLGKEDGVKLYQYGLKAGLRYNF